MGKRVGYSGQVRYLRKNLFETHKHKKTHSAIKLSGRDKSLVVKTTHRYHTPKGRRRRIEKSSVCFENFIDSNLQLSKIRSK